MKRKKDFKLEKFDLLIFSIPLIFFVIILFVFYPGILSYDSYEQLKQITTGQFENWHPFIHTFIEMICMKIWNNTASVCLLQIIIFSTIWAMICKYNRKGNSKLEYVLQIIVTIMIILNPINSIYAITLWKDILFTYGMLLLSFLIELIIDNKCNLSNNFFVFLGLLMAFISKIRFNGLITIIIFIIIMIIVLMRKKKKKACIIMVVSYLSLMGIFGGLDKLYNVKDNAKSAFNTKIMHIIGYYEKQEILNKKDNKIISNIVDLEELKSNYNPYFLDPIYSISNQKMTTKYRKQLIKIVLNKSIYHPIEFTKYAFKSSTMTWEVIRPDDAVGVILWLDVESSNNFKGIKTKHKEEKYYQDIYKIVSYTKDNKFLKTIFYSPALYMYLSIFVCLLIINISKKTTTLMILLPNIINIFIIFASTPLQDIRYLYSNFMIFYLLCIIYIDKILVDENT